MAQEKRRARVQVKELANRVQKAVDEGADSAERIHKKVANLPLDVLEQMKVLEGAVKDLRTIQERSIGAVYNLVREINHEVNRLAKETLSEGRSTPRKTRPRKKAAGGKKAPPKQATT
jgi:MinD-like ATPase involved in chromosome partitioning or flagellar assembly